MNLSLSLFKKLSDDEVSDFQNAARRSYQLGEPVNPLWHPVYRMECERMNVEWVQSPTLEELSVEANAAPDCELHERHVNVEKIKHHHTDD